MDIFKDESTVNCIIYMVPVVGLEPTHPQGITDFESASSASSDTPAHSIILILT